MHTHVQLTADGLVPYLARPFAEDCVPMEDDSRIAPQEGTLNT
jgi:hypothetical protein